MQKSELNKKDDDNNSLNAQRIFYPSINHPNRLNLITIKQWRELFVLAGTATCVIHYKTFCLHAQIAEKWERFQRGELLVFVVKASFGNVKFELLNDEKLFNESSN